MHQRLFKLHYSRPFITSDSRSSCRFWLLGWFRHSKDYFTEILLGQFSIWKKARFRNFLTTIFAMYRLLFSLPTSSPFQIFWPARRIMQAAWWSYNYRLWIAHICLNACLSSNFPFQVRKGICCAQELIGWFYDFDFIKI